MSYFHQAVAELIERVKEVEDGVNRLVQVLEEKPDFAFIDWLEAQPLFPKFYWQSRDTREEVVALGQLHTFVEPAPAYTILADDQRIWGGRSFDGHTGRCMSSFFFLPQIELIRFDQQWSLAVNLNAEKHRTLASLYKLQLEVSPILPVSSHIETIQHTPEKEQWSQLVDKVLTGIKNDEFKKVVLARKTEVNLDRPLCASQLLKASYLQPSQLSLSALIR